MSASDQTIDTTPLLRQLKAQQPTEMLSRAYLNDRGVTNAVIDEADRRGEVVVSSEGGCIASVLLTVDGDEALARRDAATGPAIGPRA